MRIGLPRSLYAKVCAVFLGVLFLHTSISVLLAGTLYKNFGLHKTQMMHWELADEVARTIQPLLARKAPIEELYRALDSVHLLNPRIGVLLLDQSGKAIVTPRERPYLQALGNVYDVSAIEEFLQPTVNREVPLFIDDPIAEEKRNIFSASRITLSDGTPGFILVLLQGARWQVYEKAFQERYLILGGFVTAAALFFITSLAGLFLFRIITRRLSNLETTVQEVSSGKLSVRVDAQGNDEIASICRGFNQMAETIEENVLELKNMDELRRKTFASITHDMGTPLTGLQGHLSILHSKGEELGHEEREKHIFSALKGARLLARFKEEIFELAKIEAQESLAVLESFSLADLVSEEVVPLLRPLAKESGVTIEYHGLDSIPLVSGDEELLKRVLSNLLENGIRYSKAGGVVAVRLQQSESHVTVSVEDNGIGIAEEDLANLFDEFYRSEAARQVNEEGTGLGLAIVKKILALHGTSIRVTSEPGVGSTFSFELAIVSST